MIRRGNSRGKGCTRRIGGKDEREGTGGGGGRLGTRISCAITSGYNLTRAMHSAGEGLLTNGEKARSVTVAVAAA